MRLGKEQAAGYVADESFSVTEGSAAEAGQPDGSPVTAVPEPSLTTG